MQSLITVVKSVRVMRHDKHVIGQNCSMHNCCDCFRSYFSHLCHRLARLKVGECRSLSKSLMWGNRWFANIFCSRRTSDITHLFQHFSKMRVKGEIKIFIQRMAVLDFYTLELMFVKWCMYLSSTAKLVCLGFHLW